MAVTAAGDRNISSGVEVFGTVQNQGSNKLAFVEVAVAYYDATGRVVHADWDLPTPSALNAGQSGVFSAPSYVSNLRSLFVRYAVQAQGRLDSSVTEAEAVPVARSASIPLAGEKIAFP